jgi:hypothetical protein
MRPDLILNNELDLGAIMKHIRAHKIYVTRDPGCRASVIGDQFAIGDLYTMNIYADLYHELFRPRFVKKQIFRTCENLLWAHLKDYGLHVIKMNNRASINRTRI